MEKYGVCKSEKEAGMGPEVGYCPKCEKPLLRQDNGRPMATCNCKKEAEQKD
jgi:hypothetical protein